MTKKTCLKTVISKYPKPHLRTPVAGDGRAKEEEMLLTRRNTYVCGKTVKVESADVDSLEKVASCWV